MRFPKMFSLEQQTAIVTGGGCGLGKAMAEGLAEAGANIVIADINPEAGSATVEYLRSLGIAAHFIHTDVTNPNDVSNMVSETVRIFGGLDILVNNAGISRGANGEPVRAENVLLHDWEKIIAVDLTGLFLCSQAAGKVMIDRRSGRIINIGSTYGQVASCISPLPAYAAAKGGVINLTKELAVEWAQFNIRVNAIAPAYFDTPLIAYVKQKKDVLNKIHDRTPLGRMGRPDEIKGSVVFLASEASSMVTGHVLNLDGGWLAW